jgi:hypothetical protein
MSIARNPARLGLLLCTAALLVAGGAAQAAAAPPTVGDTWAQGVTASGAIFHAEVNPNGIKTTYHYDYITDTAYQANLAASEDGFTGAGRIPVAVEANLGATNSFEEAIQHLGGLIPETAYRYRIVATNSSGTTDGGPHTIITQASNSVFTLPDVRGWEMVSPADKNGGEIQGFNEIFGGGVLQGSAIGGVATFSSSTSFGDAVGAPGGSQYLARRTATGWVTENITLPQVAGGYGSDGVPYQLFSDDLARGLAINGDHCRTSGTECPVANPPLPGSGAPAGYLNYYLRDSDSGAYRALLTSYELSFTDVSSPNFDVAFAGASPDLDQVVLSSCAALTSNATEVLVGGDDCDPDETNIYVWTESGLGIANVLPGDTHGTPGARLAARRDAISADGARIYWVDKSTGSLYLSEIGAGSRLVSANGTFQTASSDGGAAFFTDAGHLYRYVAPSGPATDLTPAGGVVGVLGASADGTTVYYLDGSGVHRWSLGTTTTDVADAADAGNYPPATGTARVSGDGSRLLFLSGQDLTEFESFGETQVFLYSLPGTGGSTGLVCVSCNPGRERPEGGASIPGAIANGSLPGATQLYKPRALSADGNRVFFNSADSLNPKDTNGEQDVYEWEADGVTGCRRHAGCLGPISSGRAAGGASFVDTSADTMDAYFLTDEALVGTDPGGVDLYDARIEGGFPQPNPPLACVGDACQALPATPEDPSPGTGFLTDEFNGPVRTTNLRRRHRHRRKHHVKPHRKHRGTGKSKGGRR